MNSILRITRSASALWPYYLGVLLTATITAVVALVSPFLTREATDTIVGALQNDAPLGDALRTVLLLAVALFLADAANALFRNIGGYIGDVMVSRLREIFVHALLCQAASPPAGLLR